ncbi:MAG TPA: endolytic transglycosylase MltG [Methylophilaceae bacterium]
MRLISRVLWVALFCLCLLVAWMFYFASTPMTLNTEIKEFSIKPGSVRSVSQQLTKQEVLSHPWSFELLVRSLGQAGSIKAGVYQVKQGATPYALMEMMSNGDSTQSSITFIEGWTFAQMRAALNTNESIRHMTMAYTDQQLLQEIGADDAVPEGLFFPDTYFFVRDSSDKEILKRSYQTMKAKLQTAWESRASDLPYKNAYQALIMASIVEKETGRSSERPMIAGVFINRLHMGMRLQTDPTVIYGLGSNFDGNLRKKDLLRDNPYNTYTRSGLPPTPIAMPGLAAIQAALHPAETKALYFVGKGNGSHAFSATLEEHNRAVAKYQLGKN